MKMQEIFDKVAKHLLDQGQPSMFDDRCAYRGEHFRMCAVGCLIKDEDYDPGIEGKTTSHTFVRDALRESGIPEDTKTMCLLTRLQVIHDQRPPAQWKSELFNAALAFKLSPAVVTLA